VRAGGHGTVGRGSSDTEVAAEGTGVVAGGSGGRAGGFDGANAILNSPPGDVPVIDNVRPLDRKPFARSVMKFMKVSSALAAHNCRRETERKRGCPVRGRAHVLRRAERALGVLSARTRIVANMFRSFLRWNYSEDGSPGRGKGFFPHGGFSTSGIALIRPPR